MRLVVQRIAAQIDDVAVAEGGVVGQGFDVLDRVVPQAQMEQRLQLAERCHVLDRVAVEFQPRQAGGLLQTGEIGHAGVSAGQRRQRRDLRLGNRRIRFLVERLLQAAPEGAVRNCRFRIVRRIEVDRHAAFLQRRNVRGVRIAVERIAQQVQVVAAAEAVVRHQIGDVGDAVVLQMHLLERGHRAQRGDVVDRVGVQAQVGDGGQPAEAGDVLDLVGAEVQMGQRREPRQRGDVLDRVAAEPQLGQRPEPRQRRKVRDPAARQLQFPQGRDARQRREVRDVVARHFQKRQRQVRDWRDVADAVASDPQHRKRAKVRQRRQVLHRVAPEPQFHDVGGVLQARQTCHGAVRAAGAVYAAVREEAQVAEDPVEGGHVVFGDLGASFLAKLLLHAVAERVVGDRHWRRRWVERHRRAAAFQRRDVLVMRLVVQRIAAQLDVVAVAEGSVVGQGFDVLDLVVAQTQIEQRLQLAERGHVLDRVAVQFQLRQGGGVLQTGEVGHASVPASQTRERRQFRLRDRRSRILVERLLDAATQRTVRYPHRRIGRRVEVDPHAAFLQRRNVRGVRIAVERIARQIKIVPSAEAVVLRQGEDVSDAVVLQMHVCEGGHRAQRGDVGDGVGIQAQVGHRGQPAEAGDVLYRVGAEVQLGQRRQPRQGGDVLDRVAAEPQLVQRSEALQRRQVRDPAADQP